RGDTTDFGSSESLNQRNTARTERDQLSGGKTRLFSRFFRKLLRVASGVVAAGLFPTAAGRAACSCAIYEAKDVARFSSL
ncbi:hypothetical protein KBY77_14020, partial [Synechococcus sp. Cruz-7E5]|nr:hypothetical protein [Synechococcus sp. Cruz-7E5]